MFPTSGKAGEQATTGAAARSCEGSGSGSGSGAGGRGGGEVSGEWNGVGWRGAHNGGFPGLAGPCESKTHCELSSKPRPLFTPSPLFIFVLLPRAPSLGLIGLRLFPVGLSLSCHAFLVIPPVFQFYFQLLSALVLLSSLPLILDFGSFSPLYLLAGKSSKEGKVGHVN